MPLDTVTPEAPTVNFSTPCGVHCISTPQPGSRFVNCAERSIIPPVHRDPSGPTLPSLKR